MNKIFRNIMLAIGFILVVSPLILNFPLFIGLPFCISALFIAIVFGYNKEELKSKREE